jgi:hypothetical protein
MAFSADRTRWDQRTCRPFPVSGFDDPSMASHRGEYINSLYEYSVSIPAELVGHSSPPPAPSHGFGILLGLQKDGYLWIDGSWNSFGYESSQAVGRDNSVYLKERGAVISSTKTRSWMLAGIPASRSTLQYRCPGSQEVIINDVVAALSPDKSKVWQICLDTKQSRYERDLAIYEAVLRSWRYRPSK